MNPTLRHASLVIAIASAISMMSLNAYAQEKSLDPTSSKLPTKSNVTTPGLHLGSFLLYPEIAATSAYNDNIYYTRNDRHGDTILMFSPALYVRSKWAKNSLNMSAGFDAARYQNYPTENYTDGWLNLQSGINLSATTRLFGGAGIDFQHEARSTQDAFIGQYPTRYRNNHAMLGLSQNWGPWLFRIVNTVSALDYFNVENNIGWSNDLRDRTVTAEGMRIAYRVNPHYSVFMQGTYDVRNYKANADFFGYNRDSSGYRVVAGLQFKPRTNLNGEVFYGYLRQNYSDSYFDMVNAPDFGASLQWKPSALTRITGYISRTLEETTLDGTPGYLYTTVGGKASHWLTSRARLNGYLSYGQASYRQIDRQDHLIDAGLGVDYRLTHGLFLETNYQIQGRNSNVNNISEQHYADYIDNQVSIGLRRVFYPVPEIPVSRTQPFSTSSGYGMGGFYGGLQYGYGFLGSESSGGRGTEGSDNANLGTMGGYAGIFAGYGHIFDRWYLGLEVNSDTGGTRWYHTKSKPGGRTFSIEQKNSYEGNLRLGYILNNGVLSYIRIGAMNTPFNTYYDVQGSTPTTSDKRLTGTTYGLGIETPVSRHTFIRLDYGYTDYPDYNISYSDGSTLQTENFHNVQSMVRLGVGMRFRDQPLPQSHSKVSGFYAGIQLGDNALHTTLNADQIDSGSGTAVSSHLHSDFGKPGFISGLFAGYGLVLKHHYYIGFEGEIDNSHAGWQHTRSPSGRTFSVHENAGYGASLRLGYVLNSGVLLYARAGAIVTRFNTKYQKGNNASTWIDADNIKTSSLYGFGIQTPLTRSVFLRIDYSYLTSPQYSFTTTQASPDTVQFDNVSALYRLGLGVVF